MEKYICGDIWSFLHDTSDRVYRFWVYKRMFTPLEQDSKYIDQHVFEDTHCNMGIIRECVVLPDNDILLGFQPVYDYEPVDDELENHIEYYKLSEIRMEYWPVDFGK